MRSFTHLRVLSRGHGSGRNSVSVALHVALLHAHTATSEPAHKDDALQSTANLGGEHDRSATRASPRSDSRYEGGVGVSNYDRAAMASVHAMRRYRAQYMSSCQAHAAAGTLSPLTVVGASGRRQPAACYASPSTVFTRAARAEDFDHLLHRYCEKGYVEYDRLLQHPDCPAPAVLLERVLHLCTPSVPFTERVLCAVLAPPSFGAGHGAEAAYALERVAALLRQADETADATRGGWCAHGLRVRLYEQPSVRCLLVEALLSEGLYAEVIRTLRDMPDAWMTARLWSALTQAAAQSRLPDSELLWRLLALARAARPLRRTNAGESGLLGTRTHRTVAAVSPSTTATSAPSDGEDGADYECEVERPLRSLFDVRAGSAIVVLAADEAAPSPRNVSDAGAAELMTAEDLTAAVYHACEMNQNEIAYANEHRGGLQSRCLYHAAPPRRGSTRGAQAARQGGTSHDRGAGEAADVDAESRASDGTVVRLFGTTEECLTAMTSATPSLSTEAREQIRTCAYALQLRAVGVAFGLNATTATALMLRPGFSFGGQCTPLLALHILRRYVRTCHALGKEARRLHGEVTAEMRRSVAAQQRGVLSILAEAEGAHLTHSTPSETLAALEALHSAATPHPSPFFVMLQILRDSRDVRPPLEQGVTRLTAHDASFDDTHDRSTDVDAARDDSGSTRDKHDDCSNSSRCTGDNRVNERGSSGSSSIIISNSESSSSHISSTQDGVGEGRGGVVRHYLRRGVLPMMHWELAWSTFQQLNRENPRWYTVIPTDAGELCMNVIEVLCRGADPWLTLNVARSAAARHIVDGLDITLFLLTRLDPSHHTDEARAVARRLFRWLLADIGIHLQPRLHHQLLPAARVLIRLGLYDELRVFYNTVLDNLFNFTETFRHTLMLLLADLLCPACCAMLPEHNFYLDRTCPYCLSLVPAKDASHVASFQLSAEHMQRIRARRRAHRAQARQRLSASLLQDMDDHEGGPYARRPLRGPPPDAAQVLARALQRAPTADDTASPRPSPTPPLLPGVHYEGGISLFPLPRTGDAAGTTLVVADAAAAHVPSVGAVNEGEAAATTAVLDLRSAMEESSRRLELQRAARQYALAQRGVDLSVLHAALPTSLSSLAESFLPRDGGQLDVYAQVDATATGAATLPSGSAGVGRWGQNAGSSCWTCVWCQEQNKSWLSRVQCVACGAETGPEAPWRRFVYVTSPYDVMGEIRARMMNAQGRPADALVAAYLLMLYRRTFLLRATPHDQVRVQQLVLRLCDLQERVLAAYVYTRLVPPPLRAKNRTLYALAALFGADAAAVEALTPAQLHGHDEGEEDETGAARGASAEATFFTTVFTPMTCKVCFANHDWHLCPIVTRDFASTTAHAASPTLSPQEKQRTLLEQLLRLVTAALEHGRQNTRLVVEAYAAFVRSPFRELFAEVHASETNRLSLLLGVFKQYRRAAFVLCHIPLHARTNEAYCKLVPYFDVSEEDAMRLLRHRHVGDGSDEGHPNFVQVAMTCCVCLSERHASFACPRLTQWLDAVNELVRTSPDLTTSSGSTRQTLERLRAQVQGWTSAGPERLHAFYRFLLQQLPVLQAMPLLNDADGVSFAHDGAAAAQPSVTRRRTLDDPLIYALNVTLCKLAATGRASYAYRLYAHSPMDCLTRRSTAALLRLNRFSDASIEALLRPDDGSIEGASWKATHDEDQQRASNGEQKEHDDKGSERPIAMDVAEETLAVPPPAARRAAVPMRSRCLLCFEADHAFFDCPELAAQSATAGKLAHVLRHLVGITCTHDGVTAAAAYVYWCYNRGQLSNELLREEKVVCGAMLRLARRCFAARQLALGVRVLRCLPIELVPPEPTYIELWRAAGLDEATVEARRVELLALFDAEDIHPTTTTSTTTTITTTTGGDLGGVSPRRTYSARFISNLHHCLHDQLCRHCYESGHSVATCSLFHSEVSFGRDYVAAYRMSMMSEQLEREWQDAYLLKLVLFFQTHQAFMPYHIAGVASALNAIAAMWSFRDEPGIALRHLLNIPPAYRRRQTFKHILHSLHVPTAEIARALAGFYFAPDDVNGSHNNSSSSSGSSGGITAQHLLLPKSPIRDVALRAVFEKFPAAMTALEQSEQRMLNIMHCHATHSTAVSATKSDAAAAVVETAPETGDTTLSNAVSDVARQETSFAARAATIDPMWRTLLSCKMQSGGISELREDFDPILTELEDAVGMKLGSRHVLFTTAMEVLSGSGDKVGQTPAQTASSAAMHECPEATLTTSSPQAQPGEQKASTGAAQPAVMPQRDVTTRTASVTRQRRQEIPHAGSVTTPVHRPTYNTTTTTLREGRQRRDTRHVDVSHQRGGVSTSFAPMSNATSRKGRQRGPSSGWQSSK